MIIKNIGITKWDEDSNTKLLQNVAGAYYRVRQVLQSVPNRCYKLRQVLQSVTVITKWDVTEVLKSFQSFIIISKY